MLKFLQKALLCFALGGMGFAPSPLMAYEVLDSFGKHQFSEPPKRIVVTDWTLLEQLLELDVVPVGAPELAAYREQVVRPALPEEGDCKKKIPSVSPLAKGSAHPQEPTVIEGSPPLAKGEQGGFKACATPEGIADIGLRRTPSIQKIRALKPDLIILGTDQKKFSRPFSLIARVMYYQNFSARFVGNGEKAKQRFQQLATLLQKEALAESKLAALDKKLDEQAASLTKHFKSDMPLVTLIRFAPNSTVFVYGANSMPGYVLRRLGLLSEISVEKTKFGVRRIPVEQLNDVKLGYLLYWQGDQEWNTILTDPDWQSLPAVEAGRAIPLDTAWSYGGAMSLGYMADIISDALHTLTPSPSP